MAKCGVEYAAFAVHFRPGNRKIAVLSMDPWIVEIELFRIETQQHVHLIARPIFRLIDLVTLHECMWKMAHGREIRVFDDDWGAKRCPGVLVEPSSDHLSVFGPLVVCIQSSMDADESLSIILDERHHVLSLTVVQLKFSSSARKHEHVEMIQVLKIAVL